MFGSKRVTRYIIIAAMILAGVSLIGLLMSSFDVEAEKVLQQLLAIFVLLIVLMAAAFFAALGLRAIQNRRERSRRDDEDDEN